MRCFELLRLEEEVFELRPRCFLVLFRTTYFTYSTATHRRMLGFMWSDTGRSAEVATKLQRQGRRKRKTRKAENNVREKYYVDKHSCFAMASSIHPRRLVVVNWNNHPVLDLKVLVDGELEVPDDETPEAEQKDNRPVCETFTCKSLAEATTILQEHLILRTDPEKLVLVGHGVERILYEWNVSGVSWKQQRCTATYPPYMEEHCDALSKLLLPAELSNLMQRILNRRPSKNLWHQAAAALDLYRKAQPFWEKDLQTLVMNKQIASHAKQQNQTKIDCSLGSPILTLQKEEDYRNADQKVDEVSSRERADTATSITSLLSMNRSRVNSGTSFSSLPLASDLDSRQSESIWHPSVTESSWFHPDSPAEAECNNSPILTSSFLSQEGVHPKERINDLSRSQPKNRTNNNEMGRLSQILPSGVLSEVFADDAKQTHLLFLAAKREDSNHSHCSYIGDPTSWLQSYSQEKSREETTAKFAQMLPSNLLSESFSDGDNDELNASSFAKREESSHPLSADDWLSDVTPFLSMKKKAMKERITWFGRRTSNPKNLKRDSSTHSSDHDEWLDVPPQGPFSSFYRRRDTSPVSPGVVSTPRNEPVD